MTGENETRFGKRGAGARGETFGELGGRNDFRKIEVGGLDWGVHGNTMPSALGSCEGRN
jgi:hypothetical protein